MSAIGNLREILKTAWICAVIACQALAGDVKSLTGFPESERLWLGIEEGVVRPAAYEQVRTTADGYVSLLARDGQMLKKGEHWATLDHDQLDIERRAFELEQDRQKEQLQKGIEDAEEAWSRVQSELHELEGKHGDLNSVARDKSMPPGLRDRAREAAQKLNERMEVLRDKLKQENQERELHFLREDLELQLARKEKQLRMMERRSCLTAANGGQLRLGDTMKERIAEVEPGELVWVKANEVLATIVDDNSYEIRVSAAGPLLEGIRREELLVFLQDSETGRLVPGEYERTEEIDNGREITRDFVFSILAVNAAEARRAQGTRSLVHVYRKFNRPYRLVYKKDIAFVAPEVLETSGWSGLIKHLWPGSRVIHVGPQTIAVEPKDEN